MPAGIQSANCSHQCGKVWFGASSGTAAIFQNTYFDITPLFFEFAFFPSFLPFQSPPE